MKPILAKGGAKSSPFLNLKLGLRTLGEHPQPWWAVPAPETVTQRDLPEAPQGSILRGGHSSILGQNPTFISHLVLGGASLISTGTAHRLHLSPWTVKLLRALTFEIQRILLSSSFQSPSGSRAKPSGIPCPPPPSLSLSEEV